jgi:Tol biopolymer transport system component
VQRLIILVVLLAMLTGCSSATKELSTTAFYVFRMEPPGLIELSPDNEVTREIPVAIPGGCGLGNVYAPPAGSTLAIEFNCEFGQAVVYVNTDSGEIKQPITDSDSHFMAWTPDGQAAYLKVDIANRPHIVRAPLRGKARYTPLTELTYDISPKAGSADLFFSFSRGMGQGSEMWYAWDGGRSTKQVLADPQNYLSFARWSPDGSQIAFIKIPDSATPFTVGELWVMNADGSSPRKLADADAGHGYAEAWSPDGSRIALVIRENPNDVEADQNGGALKSNVAIVNVRDGSRSELTRLQDARVEAPVWSPDGNRLAFTVVLNDKMNVYIADSTSGKVEEVLPVAACCPVWIRK